MKLPLADGTLTGSTLNVGGDVRVTDGSVVSTTAAASGVRAAFTSQAPGGYVQMEMRGASGGGDSRWTRRPGRRA